jgi:hypothetical protein
MVTPLHPYMHIVLLLLDIFSHTPSMDLTRPELLQMQTSDHIFDTRTTSMAREIVNFIYCYRWPNYRISITHIHRSSPLGSSLNIQACHLNSPTKIMTSCGRPHCLN